MKRILLLIKPTYCHTFLNDDGFTRTPALSADKGSTLKVKISLIQVLSREASALLNSKTSYFRYAYINAVFDKSTENTHISDLSTSSFKNTGVLKRNT